MSAWQPIESVPKDGTKVLLGRFVKECQCGRSSFIEVDWYRQQGEASYTGFGRFSLHWPPTHWMPLPPPPETPHE